MESEESVSRSERSWVDALGVDVGCLIALPERAWSNSDGDEASRQRVTPPKADLRAATLPQLGLGGPHGAVSLGVGQAVGCRR
ncbi:hypothetical protein B296_00017848 [Ensete ventricosum]|uniref:Uncharacterized protein n=1 Tax=Ensete ventricosum TaxID=4639 RepID=A0A427ABM2_ENSVE|nr:hypothetical protein B296_00017848 [Ensete ventricosum]